MILLLGLTLLETVSRGTPWILLLGPAGAVGVYWGLFQYYRNTGRSHSFERETSIESKPVSGTDQLVDRVEGTRRSTIDGDNSSDYRRRVRRV